jgi:plasmid maintenance system antidote protein VapI
VDPVWTPPPLCKIKKKISQKMAIFIITVVGTSNPTWVIFSFFNI